MCTVFLEISEHFLLSENQVIGYEMTDQTYTNYFGSLVNNTLFENLSIVVSLIM